MAKTTEIRYERDGDGKFITDAGGTPIPLRVDGKIREFNEWTPGPDGQIHLYGETGPAKGVITLSNGRQYDVGPDTIQVDSPEDAAALDFHVYKQHEATGLLTRLLHGSEWTGTAATVEGDESSYQVVPGVAAEED